MVSTLLLLLLPAISAGSEKMPPPSPWRQSDFIIGTAQDPYLSNNINPHPIDSMHNAELHRDIYNYQYCKNAYFTMVTGLNNLWNGHPCDTPVPLGQQKIDYSLFLASAVGLRSLVLHEPWGSCNCSSAFLSFMRTENTTPYRGHVNYASYITAHYKGLGMARHAALQGYQIAMEPLPDETAYSCGSDGFTHGIDTLTMWVKALKIYDPARQSFVTILPFQIGPFSADTAAYKKHIDRVYNDPDRDKRPQVICGNPYPLCDWARRPSAEETFFWVLTTYRFQAGGRPFWNYIHCIFTYRDFDAARNPHRHMFAVPDENNLRWYAFTNVAHGAKGLIWFTYLSINKDLGVWGNFGQAIVDSANRSWNIAGSTPPRTAYAVVREINRYLACIVGPMVMTSNFINVYHTKFSGPDAGGNYSVVPNQKYIPARQVLGNGANDSILQDVGDTAAMAGVFRDKVNPATYYLFVVNKHWEVTAATLTDCSVTLKGDCRNRVFLAPRAYGYDGSTAYEPMTVRLGIPASGYCTVIIPELKGGEGRLIKVTGVGGGNIRPGFRPQGEIGVGRNAIDKRLICFARGADDSLYARIQDTANVDFWGSQWTPLAVQTTVGGNIVCANCGPHSPLWLFSTTARGDLLYSRQKSPADKTKPLWFSAWQTASSTPAINSPLALSCRGVSQRHLVIFFRCGTRLGYAGDSRGGLFVLRQVTAPGIPSAIGSHIGVGYNPDSGSVDVFLTDDRNRRLYRGRMNADASWLPFTPVYNQHSGDQTADGEIAVGTNADNRLEVFVSSGGYIYHSRQQRPGSLSWSSFTRLDTSAHAPEVAGDSALCTVVNNGGRLELFTKGRDGFLKHTWQQLPNGPWSPAGLVPVGAGAATAGTTHLCAVNNGDGRPEVLFACAGAANIFFTSNAPDVAGIDWQNCLPLTNLSSNDR
jgi:hypothetical protein